MYVNVELINDFLNCESLVDFLGRPTVDNVSEEGGKFISNISYCTFVEFTLYNNEEGKQQFLNRVGQFLEKRHPNFGFTFNRIEENKTRGSDVVLRLRVFGDTGELKNRTGRNDDWVGQLYIRNNRYEPISHFSFNPADEENLPAKVIDCIMTDFRNHIDTPSLFPGITDYVQCSAFNYKGPRLQHPLKFWNDLRKHDCLTLTFPDKMETVDVRLVLENVPGPLDEYVLRGFILQPNELGKFNPYRQKCQREEKMKNNGEEEITTWWNVVLGTKPITNFEVGLFSSRELTKLLGKPLFGNRNEHYDPDIPVFECLKSIHPEFDFNHVIELGGGVLMSVANKVTGEGWMGYYCFRTPARPYTWLKKGPDEESCIGDLHGSVLNMMVKDLQHSVNNSVVRKTTTTNALVIDYAGPRLEYSHEFWEYLKNSDHFQHINRWKFLLNTPGASAYTTNLILEKTQEEVLSGDGRVKRSPKLTLRGFIFEGVSPKRESSKGKRHVEAANNEYERNQLIDEIKKTGDQLFSKLVPGGYEGILEAARKALAEEEPTCHHNEPSHISQGILRDISNVYKNELLEAVEEWKSHPGQDEQMYTLTPQNTFDGVTRRYCNIALFQAWEYFIKNFRQTLEPSSIKTVVPVLSFMDDNVPVVTFYLLK